MMRRIAYSKTLKGVAIKTHSAPEYMPPPDGIKLLYRLGVLVHDELEETVTHLAAIGRYDTAEPQQTAPATDPAPLEADAMTPSPAPAQNTATPAPEATGGKKWTPEKLAELKTYREAHTMPETAVKFGISEQRIRELLPSKKPKAKPFPGLIHRMK